MGLESERSWGKGDFKDYKIFREALNKLESGKFIKLPCGGERAMVSMRNRVFTYNKKNPGQRIRCFKAKDGSILLSKD